MDPRKPGRAPPPGPALSGLHFHKFHVPPSATLHPAHVIEANYLVQKNRERISSCLCLHNGASNKELQLMLIRDQLSSASQGRTGPARGKLWWPEQFPEDFWGRVPAGGAEFLTRDRASGDLAAMGCKSRGVWGPWECHSPRKCWGPDLWGVESHGSCKLSL